MWFFLSVRDKKNKLSQYLSFSFSSSCNMTFSFFLLVIKRLFKFYFRNLLAAAEPHGQVFTLTEIVGHVKESYHRLQSSNPSIHSARPTRDSVDSINESSFEIECNKRYLAWGGNDIGNIMYVCHFFMFLC